MTTPCSEVLVLTLENGMLLFSHLIPSEAGWYSWRIDCDAPGGGIISGGSYSTRDRVISALFSAAAYQWASRVISAMPKEQWEASIGIAVPKDRVDETATLQTRVTELEVIVRAVAEDDPIEDVGVCPWCRSDVHFDDCVWLRARKAMGMATP